MKTRLLVLSAMLAIAAAACDNKPKATTESGQKAEESAKKAGAAVGAAVEIPNAVITSIPRGERSVVVQERVVVGEPLPPAVELRVVPNHTEYRYAVVNDQRVIVKPRTRKVIRVID